MMNVGEEVHTTSEKDIYFAAQKPEKLANECLAKAQSFYNTMNANFYLDKLAKQWQFYHGEFSTSLTGNSHQVGFTGEEGELVSLPANHYRNIAQHMLVMITSNRPSMEARSVNTDYKSLAQTYLANGILDYYMREKRLEDAIRKSTEYAIVMGAGYIRMEWNATAGELYDFDPESGEKNFEGELEFSVHSPFDVVFDGTKENWDNDWIMIRSFKNKYNLIAKYPEMKDKINSIPTKSENATYRIAVFSNDNTDDIPVYEFYHKKTEALPEGRYAMFLDTDIVLLDLPLPYKEIPIYRVAAGEYLGTPYAYSPMFDVYPIQEAVNSLYSTIMTNQAAFGVQNLYVPRGADIAVNSLEGALNIIEGNAKPEALNLTQTPKEVFDFLQVLIQSMETISGVNSVARGDPQSSLKSGTALALVQSMALQFLSGLQNSYIKLIEDVGNGLINILKDYANTPKTIALVGKNKAAYLKEFTGDDINSINRVIVSVGNALAQSTAGRVQMAEQMLQMGIIKNPKQYFQVLTTGSIETIYESDMDTLLLIKDENEHMMSGEEVLADMLDEHNIHIMEHRSVMANPDLRRDPKLRAIVQDHIQQHIDFLRTVDHDLLQLIGQTPLMNPQEAALQNAPGADGSMPPAPGQAPTQGSPSEQLAAPSVPKGGDMITGAGTKGGEMIPQPATPPPPFDQTNQNNQPPQQ